MPTVRRPLFAARYSPPTLHGPPPRSASTVRLHGPPPAVRRSPLVACAYCSPPAVCRLLPAVCRPPPQSATRCLPPALCRPLPQPADRRLSFATLRPLLSARYSPPATLRPPPLPATLRLPAQPAITVRRPQTAAARVDSSPANLLLSGYALNRPHMCAERRSMLFCLASDVVETEFLFIFVQINKGKQLFIPLANRGNFIRRLFEPGMGVVSTVLCLDLRIGAGTGTGRFSCSGSLKPALRGTDLRFFAGNKAARSLFRGGVRRCITVGISDEIPVLPSRLDFRGGGCDLGVTDNILPGGFLFLPFVSERRVYRGVTQERSPTGVPSAAPFFRGRADGQYVTTY